MMYVVSVLEEVPGFIVGTAMSFQTIMVYALERASHGFIIYILSLAILMEEAEHLEGVG